MKLKNHRLKPRGVFKLVQSTKIKKPSTTRRQHVTIPTDACWATCHPNLQFTFPSLRIHSGRFLWGHHWQLSECSYSSTAARGINRISKLAMSVVWCNNRVL